jgi:hypothetical protein
MDISGVPSMEAREAMLPWLRKEKKRKEVIYK